MKRNRKQAILIVLITIVTIYYLCNIIINADTIKTSVEVKYTAPVLMKYGNIKIDTPIVKVKINEKEYPAYCLDVHKKGAGEKIAGYGIDINKQIENNLVYSMIVNGYPYKTLEELGAKTEAEAFTATKQAVYTAIYGREITDYSAIDTEEGRRTYEIYKNIVINGRKNENKYIEGSVKIKELTDWQVTGENNEKIRKKIKVETNKKGKVTIKLESKIDGVKIIGENNKEKQEIKENEEVYIEIEIKNIKEDGKLNIKLEAELETNPIYLGEPGNDINQPYAVSGIKVKGKTKVDKEFYYKKNETKVKIKKIDGDTKEGLKNVEFELLDKEKRVIKIIKTDGDGNIIIDNILEGKYYLKEIKTNSGYILDDKIIEIDIKYQENIEIEIVNNKIKIIPKKKERILPRTGY